MAKKTKPKSEPQPGQPISLRTLGEYLNLSPATISLVLNDAPGVRSIPQETRDRVNGGGSQIRLPAQLLCAFAAQAADLFDWRAGAGTERQLYRAGADRRGRVS